MFGFGNTFSNNKAVLAKSTEEGINALTPSETATLLTWTRFYQVVNGSFKNLDPAASALVAAQLTVAAALRKERA